MNNRLDFIYDLQSNPLIPNRDDFLKLLPKEKMAPESDLVPHNNINFAELKQIISENQLLAQSNIQSGIYTIWRIFQDSENVTFLTDGVEDKLKLDSFIEKQFSHLSTTTVTFKKAITGVLEGVIGSALSDQFALPKREKQRFKSVITLVTRMLHTVFLTIGDNSLEQYISIFSRFIIKENTSQIINPKFVLDLLIDDEQKLNFSPFIEMFEAKLTNLFEQLEVLLMNYQLLNRFFLKLTQIQHLSQIVVKPLRRRVQVFQIF